MHPALPCTQTCRRKPRYLKPRVPRPAWPVGVPRRPRWRTPKRPPLRRKSKSSPESLRVLYGTCPKPLAFSVAHTSGIFWMEARACKGLRERRLFRGRGCRTSQACGGLHVSPHSNACPMKNFPLAGGSGLSIRGARLSGFSAAREVLLSLTSEKAKLKGALRTRNLQFSPYS